MKKLPFVSIIVCTRNGGLRISACVRSLLDQTYPAARREIIVVNDGSTDQTGLELARFKSQIKIVTNPQNLGLSPSRNRGIAKSKGDIVAFTDDDCVADKNWIRDLIPLFKPGVGIVGGRINATYAQSTLVSRYTQATNPLLPVEVDIKSNPGFLKRLYLYLKRSFRPFDQNRGTREVYSVSGANMLIARPVLKKLHNFDADLVNYGEDLDFIVRYHAEFPDARVMFSDSGLINHIFASDFMSLINRSKTYGRGNRKVSSKPNTVKPIIFPFPVLVAVSALVAIVWYGHLPLLLAILVLLPQLFYFKWPALYVSSGNSEYLVYPYLDLVKETAHIYGFLSQK